MGLYGIGQHVLREEDPRLLRGHGRYVDDVKLPQEARAYVLRSPHAHAKITSIDAGKARQAPGVLCVLTAEEVKKRGLGMLRPALPRKRRDGSPAYVCSHPLLATDRVRYVGQPVAFIVAETLDQAKDAAELVEVDYEVLPAVVSAVDAVKPGAPRVWDDNPSNEAFFHEVGDKAAVDAEFAKAAKIVKHSIVVNRITTNSMEPRGCIAEYDPDDGRWTLRATVQSVHGPRAQIAGAILKVPQTRLRVICDNMGGGFGMKGGAGPEYGLALFAAELTGRPVKWISERQEGILSDEQARDSVVETELALDKDGTFLALRTLHYANIGAHNTSERNIMPTIVALGCLANVYNTKAIHAGVVGVLTNTMNIAFYRGGGRPEPLYVVEVIVDKAAREMGIDPMELRRRNAVPVNAMPYTTPLKQVYDVGDFIKTIDDCAAKAGYGSVAERRAEAKKRGKLLGVGMATTVAPAAGNEFEHAEVRFDPSGSVTLITGSMDHGQGHGTTFKQVLSEKLGIDADLIRYRYGDTDVVTQGIGTFGSRSAVLAGSATVVAAERIVEKGKKIAAHILEAAEQDIVFAKGKFTVTGTDRAVDIREVAQKSFHAMHMPKDLEPGLTARSDYSGPATFPNGTHIAEVEIDEGTGRMELTKYYAVDDVGVMINPMLCEGQIYGGIVQGAGQAMMEDLVYDKESGQLLTGSFQDYCMPRADDFPDFDLTPLVIPTKRNPLGVKGAGEAGTCGAIPAVMNAVNDALHHVGAKTIEMPATPEKVWRAIAGANGGRS
jgi:carbon-monoxide dehydrogenase large subunit